MIEKIKKIVRRFPNLYKILSGAYKTFLSPIVSGHLRYYIHYSLSIRRKEIEKLKSYGLRSIRPHEYKSWRIGKGKDKVHRRYYLATYKEKKCFIKIGVNDLTVNNEYNILQHLCYEDIDFSPRFLFGDDNFSNHTVMIAIEYLENLKNFELPDNVIDFENICNQFNDILDKLALYNIVHADIHKGNLMICNKKLILLDYGISMIKDKGNIIDYSYRPGTFYITEDNFRIYDDAYAFIQMIKKQGIPEEYKNTLNYKRINQRIGCNFFRVNIQN